MRILLRPINLLLLAGPLGVAALTYGWGDGWAFICLALAIIPLAGLIAGFTDALADRVGERVGGLLEATFGNAAFIILGIFSLMQGLTIVVSASIAGAIITNTLFVLGTAFFLGTMRGKRQTFAPEIGTNYSKLLALAVVALVLPAIAEHSTPLQGDVVTMELSVVAAVILFLLYVAYLLYDIFHLNDLAWKSTSRVSGETAATDHVLTSPLAATLSDATTAPREPSNASSQRETVNPENAPVIEYRAEVKQRLTALSARRGRGSDAPLHPALAVIGLVLVIAATVYLSEFLVELIKTITEGGEPIDVFGLKLRIQLSEVFIGLVVIPLIGTAAEHLSAIRSAVAGRTEITIAVTAGAAIQVALLAAPIFVLVSILIQAAHPFTLIFTPIELAVFGLATFLFYLVTEDGEGTWLEGVQLIAFYLIFAGTAYFL